MPSNLKIAFESNRMKVFIAILSIQTPKMQTQCYSFVVFIIIITNMLLYIDSMPPLSENHTNYSTRPQANDSKVIYKYLSAKNTCFFRGLNYKSGEKIIRRNPCHHCVCAKGSVQCFWQSCPPPPEGCSVIPYEGVCNPSIYNCPIPERNTTYVKSRRRQKFGSRKSDEGLVRADCVIRGIAYFTGETIGVASNNCLECRCAKNSMYCTPLCCFQRTTVDENFGINYRRIDTQNRVADPNPLAHINEDLGLPPAGAI